MSLDQYGPDPAAALPVAAVLWAVVIFLHIRDSRRRGRSS